MLNYPLPVFLDTNIFIGCRYDLKEGELLSKLKKLVDDKKIKLYISNIVLRETERHIKLDITNAVNELKKARKEIAKNISPAIVDDTLISHVFKKAKPNDIKDIENKAITKFRRFLDDANVTILDNKGIDIDSIIEDYFEGNPPFEDKEAKKYEFPDAFIISKLKKEFNENKPIWIISADKGFKKALDRKKGFNCLGDIGEFLDILSRLNEKMYKEIEEYINGQPDVIINKIKEKIEADDIEVNGLDYDRSGVYDGYEYSHSMIDNVLIENINLKSVDEIGDKLIDLTVICKAEISVNCFYDDYDNSIWDSEEKEYMFLREMENYEEHYIEFQCKLKLKVDSENSSNEFSLINISYDIVLNQESRTNRILLSAEYDRLEAEAEAEAERMEAQEEYWRH
ncbi:PIN domain-containing protein [Clostridium perfringens]|uniref:PIN domain-containing protein n=1 Tax=Clostridium perfringens TaxID=1502 RepID=UPI0013E3AB04|nr:PIN domain-containing protein [Clostridium perfringens]MDH2339170.1 PIN domain-containing protein [Clostridium perfringens]MDM0691020.1 PIN domain-containing protein [Clostridium perfringens]MDM0696845.1 PIN domain-containing protein [Clostridium perfringens]MDN4736458.1 PIN domain-containing protein [Clostridium perfringens]MDN4739921.1 PIN domain-containing protein [Clostridium perfringens]